MQVLRAERLTLIAYDAELAVLQADDPARFFDRVNAEPVSPWPPPPFDVDAMEWVRASLAVDPDGVGWYGWIMALEPQDDGRRVLVGAAALLGRPEAGEVELGFGVLEAFRGHGVASEAVRLLSRWALENGARQVVVHVDQSDEGGARTLARNGFSDTRQPPYPGVARWALAL